MFFIQQKKKKQKPISKTDCYNLKEHTDVIQYLLILHDKRLVSGSNVALIIIYNNNYQKHFIFNIHCREVYNIIENKSNDIISCFTDKKICIIQLFNNTYITIQIIKSHFDQVTHIREFSNLNLFSTSLDKSIKIWNKQSGYQLITTLKIKDKFIQF
jgi:WD40 repeat protein